MWPANTTGPVSARYVRLSRESVGPGSDWFVNVEGITLLRGGVAYAPVDGSVQPPLNASNPYGWRNVVSLGFVCTRQRTRRRPLTTRSPRPVPPWARTSNWIWELTGPSIPSS